MLGTRAAWKKVIWRKSKTKKEIRLRSRLERPVKKKPNKPTKKNPQNKTQTLNMGSKNTPERGTKWITTGIFHCTEYI